MLKLSKQNCAEPGRNSVLHTLMQMKLACVMAAGMLLSGMYMQQRLDKAFEEKPRFLLNATTPVAINQPLSNTPNTLVAPPKAKPKNAGAKMQQVVRYLSKRYAVSRDSLQQIVKAAQKYGKQNGVDPMLILALTGVESGYNPLAQNVTGAMGLMQIVPRFHPEKVGVDADPIGLLDPVENIRVGTLVLKECLQRYSTLHRALQRYNGSLNDPEQAYANKVLLEKARLEQQLAEKPATEARISSAAPQPSIDNPA